MQPGDPLDPASKMGAIVDRKQTEGVMKYVEAGKQTAKLVAGGEQSKNRRQRMLRAADNF